MGQVTTNNDVNDVFGTTKYTVDIEGQLGYTLISYTINFLVGPLGLFFGVFLILLVPLFGLCTYLTLRRMNYSVWL